jgi:hypothetical protein
MHSDGMISICMQASTCRSYILEVHLLIVRAGPMPYTTYLIKNSTSQYQIPNASWRAVQLEMKGKLLLQDG